MESTVNDRVIQLKKHTGFSDNRFSNAVGISAGTLNRIKLGDDVSVKTVTLICESLGVNREWLEKGVGDMFIPGRVSNPPIASESNWKDEAYRRLEDEVSYLRELLRMAMSSGQGNFQKVSDNAGIIELYPITGVRAAG